MRSLIRAFASRLNKLLTEHHLEFLRLHRLVWVYTKLLVKMPHCWKSRDAAHVYFNFLYCRLVPSADNLWGLVKSSGPGPEVIKLFSCSTQLSAKFQLLIKLKYLQMKKFLALSFSDAVFIMLINVKMPTIVGILTFMCRINFVLSWVEHGKSFINNLGARSWSKLAPW